MKSLEVRTMQMAPDGTLLNLKTNKGNSCKIRREDLKGLIKSGVVVVKIAAKDTQKTKTNSNPAHEMGD